MVSLMVAERPDEVQFEAEGRNYLAGVQFGNSQTTKERCVARANEAVAVVGNNMLLGHCGRDPGVVPVRISSCAALGTPATRFSVLLLFAEGSVAHVSTLWS